jgi:CRP-like cAMP-binding protein
MPADPGEALFFEGDPCEHVFELRKGIVRGVSNLPDGERQISAFFFAGDQIGLPVAESYRFTAEAVTSVLYVRYSRQRWHEALILSCREDGRLLPSICAEQDPMFRRGIIIGRNSVLVRIGTFLVSMIDRLPEIDKTLHFPLSQVDIAAYLAITPESVCRGFRQLREMGVIAMPRRDRLVVKDRVWLETIASGVVG